MIIYRNLHRNQFHKPWRGSENRRSNNVCTRNRIRVRYDVKGCREFSQHKRFTEERLNMRIMHEKNDFAEILKNLVINQIQIWK